MIASIVSRVGPLVDELHELAERLRPSIVAVREEQRGMGTGLIWSDSGVIVTNDHVARGDTPEVFIEGQGWLSTQVIGRDRDNDLAALQLNEPRAGVPASIGDARDLRIGQLVIAMGHPLGVENAITVGVLSRTPSSFEGRELLCSDLHLMPGNSGGPLVDAQGQVIGINAMVAGPGTSLSVPSHVVQAFIARVSGHIPYLGLAGQPVILQKSFRGSLPFAVSSGVLVANVEPDSPAENAGIYPGDVIVGVGKNAVWTPNRLRDEILLAGVDHPLRLTLLRAGQPLEIVAELAIRRQDAA